MRKEHAQHNEKACEYLLASGEFNDWVVTTAFYSALHYVNHQIFPFTFNRKEFTNIDSYHNSVVGPHNRISKHGLTIKLVGKYLTKAHPSYEWLYDNCMTARYNNYNISKAKAVERLHNIKKACTKP